MHTVLPSPSAQSGVPYLRKRSRSPWFRLPAPSAVSPPWGPHSAKAAWFSPGMAVAPGFKSQHQSSSIAPFPTLPTISYTASIPVLFQLYWAAILSPGRCGPMAWSQFSPSSRASAVTGLGGGALPPGYILDGSHFHPSSSKHGHSYLTYPWNQLKVIDMLNDHSRG